MISMSDCLSVCVRNSETARPNFASFCAARSDDFAIRYVLPVLWMTSRFHAMGPMGQNQARLCLEGVRQMAVAYRFYIRQLQCLVEFIKMRHRRRSLWLTCFV